MRFFLKMRPKDWRRLVFAILCIAGVAGGLTLVFANPLVTVIGALVFGVLLLAQRPYLYLRWLILPKWNQLPRNDWGHYFYED